MSAPRTPPGNARDLFAAAAAIRDLVWDDLQTVSPLRSLQTENLMVHLLAVVAAASVDFSDAETEGSTKRGASAAEIAVSSAIAGMIVNTAGSSLAGSSLLAPAQGRRQLSLMDASVRLCGLITDAVARRVAAMQSEGPDCTTTIRIFDDGTVERRAFDFRTHLEERDPDGR